MGPQGMEEMAEQLRGLFSQMGQEKRKTRKLKIKEAFKQLIDEEFAPRYAEANKVGGEASTQLVAQPLQFAMVQGVIRSSNGNTLDLGTYGTTTLDEVRQII